MPSVLRSLDRLSYANRTSMLALLLWLALAAGVGWRLLIEHRRFVVENGVAGPFVFLTLPFACIGALIALVQFAMSQHTLRRLTDVDERPELTRERDLVLANRAWSVWLTAANLLPVLVATAVAWG